jgi:hypothetical protein
MDWLDRQWLQAVAAVLIGLWLAGGAEHRSGSLEIHGPLRPVATAFGEAGCTILGSAGRAAATIMTLPTGGRG